MIFGIVGNRIGFIKEYVFERLAQIGITTSDTIISGGADGVDTHAQEFAKFKGCNMAIPKSWQYHMECGWKQ